MTIHDMPERERVASRRRALLSVDFRQVDVLFQAFVRGEKYRWHGIPDDVKCVGVHADPLREVLTFVLESETFQKVSTACMPPEMSCWIENVDGDEMNFNASPGCMASSVPITVSNTRSVSTQDMRPDGTVWQGGKQVGTWHFTGGVPSRTRGEQAQ